MVTLSPGAFARHLFVVLSLVGLGCGGATFSAGGGDDGGDAGGDGAPGSACPASMPSTGSPCSGSLECEYGNDPKLACDSVAACVSGAWSVRPPARASCGTTNPPGCPASFAALGDGSVCSPLGLDCLYPEARCDCSPSACLGGPCHIEPDGGQPPPVWVCNVPSGGICPVPRPRIGSSCSQDGQQCNYGACTGGIALLCANGVWQNQGVGCPATGG